MPPQEDDKSQLVPGAVVAGRYELVEPCGSGGMGSVWRANHLTLGSTVAIKFLHGSVAHATESRARFEREAKLCAQLGDESMNIVRVTDHGVTAHGRPFLVMELLRGESLADRLEREGRLPLAEASFITTQLCRALHVAHIAGVIHRDLKPANVFLVRTNEAPGFFVKLLDFGVAKATLELDAPAVTRAGFVVGTPAYMSPEQITGEKFIDARSDLWGVAAIVYRMTVGAPPFGSGALNELGRRITTEEPKPPSEVADDLPRELDAWMRRGLAKKRDERFQATTDLAEALSKIVGAPQSRELPLASSRRLERGAPPARGSYDETALASPSLDGRTSVVWTPPRSYGVPIVIALLSLAVAGVVAFLVISAHDNVPHPQPPPSASSTAPIAPIAPSPTTTASAAVSATSSAKPSAHPNKHAK